MYQHLKTFSLKMKLRHANFSHQWWWFNKWREVTALNRYHMYGWKWVYSRTSSQGQSCLWWVLGHNHSHSSLNHAESLLNLHHRSTFERPCFWWLVVDCCQQILFHTCYLHPHTSLTSYGSWISSHPPLLLVWISIRSDKWSGSTVKSSPSLRVRLHRSL